MNILAANGLMKSLVQRPQTKLQERFVDALDTSSVQSVTKSVPWLFRRGGQLPPVQKNDVLIASQVEREAVMMKIRRAPKIFEAQRSIAKC